MKCEIPLIKMAKDTQYKHQGQTDHESDRKQNMYSVTWYCPIPKTSFSISQLLFKSNYLPYLNTLHIYSLTKTLKRPRMLLYVLMADLNESRGTNSHALESKQTTRSLK